MYKQVNISLDEFIDIWDQYLDATAVFKICLNSIHPDFCQFSLLSNQINQNRP